jgi:hypothetical protein
MSEMPVLAGSVVERQDSKAWREYNVTWICPVRPSHACWERPGYTAFTTAVRNKFVKEPWFLKEFCVALWET